MKYLGATIIFVLGLWSCNEEPQHNDADSFKKQASSMVDKTIKQTEIKHNKSDFLQYEIFLDKEVYSIDEAIKISLVAKNTTTEKINIWIDAGDYPTGTELDIIDSKGKSLVRQHWAFMSSQTYTIEEAEQFKTTILPDGEFKKEYNLLSVVQLSNDLTKGTYELNYNNAEPVKFEIK
ncbi:hypothetical protein [Crocinitomix catalasitica]|uniref:hypothetical protein n=1 Tax=Crocinitomix catalasitica TaxID=184607 RepID=UPI0004837DBD|nr:hypothetical protein [Crocinitomix catalasitica]